MNKIFCKNILLEYRFVHMYDWVSKSLSFTIISIICKECVNEFYMNHQSLITNRLDDFLGCRKKNQIDILVVTCSRKINPVKLESLQYDDLLLYIYLTSSILRSSERTFPACRSWVKDLNKWQSSQNWHHLTLGCLLPGDLYNGCSSASWCCISNILLGKPWQLYKLFNIEREKMSSQAKTLLSGNKYKLNCN